MDFNFNDKPTNFDNSILSCKFSSMSFTSNGNIRYIFTVEKNDGSTFEKSFFANVPKPDAVSWQVDDFAKHGLCLIDTFGITDFFNSDEVKNLEQNDYAGLANLAMSRINAHSGTEVVVYGSYEGEIVDGTLIVNEKNTYKGRPNISIGSWKWCKKPSDAKPWMARTKVMAIECVKNNNFSVKVNNTTEMESFGTNSSDLPF